MNGKKMNRKITGGFLRGKMLQCLLYTFVPLYTNCVYEASCCRSSSDVSQQRSRGWEAAEESGDWVGGKPSCVFGAIREICTKLR